MTRNRRSRASEAIQKRANRFFTWASEATQYSDWRDRVEHEGGLIRRTLKRPRYFRDAQTLHAYLLRHLAPGFSVEVGRGNHTTYGTQNPGDLESVVTSICELPLVDRRTIRIAITHSGQNEEQNTVYVSLEQQTRTVHARTELSSFSRQALNDVTEELLRYTDELEGWQRRASIPIIEPGTVLEDRDARRESANIRFVNRRAAWVGTVSGFIAGLIPGAVSIVLVMLESVKQQH